MEKRGLLETEKKNNSEPIYPTHVFYHNPCQFSSQRLVQKKAPKHAVLNLFLLSSGNTVDTKYIENP
jgi:hypothetical protein